MQFRRTLDAQFKHPNFRSKHHHHLSDFPPSHLPHVVRLAQHPIVAREQRLIERVAQLTGAVIAAQTLIVPAPVHHLHVETIGDHLRAFRTDQRLLVVVAALRFDGGGCGCGRRSRRRRRVVVRRNAVLGRIHCDVTCVYILRVGFPRGREDERHRADEERRVRITWHSAHNCATTDNANATVAACRVCVHTRGETQTRTHTHKRSHVPCGSCAMRA